MELGRGGAGAWGARAPSEFGRSVNPIQTRGADFAPHTAACTPPPPSIQKAIYTSNYNAKMTQEFWTTFLNSARSDLRQDICCDERKPIGNAAFAW